MLLSSETSSELEKLRLANQLANEILLEKSKQNLGIEDTACHIKKDYSAVEKSPKLSASGNRSDEVEEQLKAPNTIQVDNWGANEYLSNGNRFQFVADYLDRTGRLLNMTNSVKILSTPGSYKTVQSSEDLRCNTAKYREESDSKKLEPSIDGVFHGLNFAESALNKNPQFESPISDSYCTVCNDEHQPSTSFSHDNFPVEIEKELKTHRPNVEVNQMSIFIPPYDNKKSSYLESDSKVFHGRGFHGLSFQDQQQKKVMSEAESSKISKEVKPKDTFANEFSDFLDHSKEDVEANDNIDSRQLTTLKTKEIAGIETAQPSPFSSIQVEPLKSDNQPATSNLHLLDVLMQSRNSSEMFFEPLLEKSMDDKNDNHTKAVVTDYFEGSVEFDKDTWGSGDVLDIAGDDNFSPETAEIEKLQLQVPKLDICDNACEELDHPVHKPRTKTRSKPPPILIKQPRRPASAGQKKVLPISKNVVLDDPHKVSNDTQSLNNNPKTSVNSPIKTKRPASAGKINELAKSNVSPKRCWEKSSIAWDSYGRGQLNTWSSVNLPAAKLPLENSVRALSPTRKVQKSKLKMKSVVNLFSEAVSNATRITWLKLPDEILIQILSFLSLKDLLNVAKVCKRLNQISSDYQLWKKVVVNDVSITNEWLLTVGQKSPVHISFTNCAGKAVTNIGLRNFFKNSKTTLERLHVGNCSGDVFSGDSMLLHASCHCRNLKHVSVPWSRTTDNGITAICLALPVLQSLNLNGNPAITNDSFVILKEKHCKSLLCLEIAGCFAITSDALLSFAKNANRLHTLNVGLCGKLTSECIKTMSGYLPKLRYLDLRGVKSVTNSCLHSIATQCKCLQSLIISNCTAITDVGLAEISTYLNSLSHLDISGCSSVTDQGIGNFVSVAKSIEYLDISSTGATFITVELLMKCSFETIRSLKLSFCNNITQASLVGLLNVALKLKSLHLYGCKRLKLSALMKINKSVVIEK